jgi:hypothetical protein
MESFMKTLAVDIWPPQKRIGMCYRIFIYIGKVFEHQ